MLELKKITKSYTVGKLKQSALECISLNFRKNEFVSVLGPSGSGKTTLLNIIGGLDKYTTGDLIINGKSTKKFKDKDWDSYRNTSIGFIFQNYNLIDHISVYENVEMALTLTGVKKNVRKHEVMKALKKVGLEKHADKKPNQLSGGQMQRVAIARALVNNPKIILADEPTGALDSKTSVKIMKLIKEISNDKLVIMVTHNDCLAKKYSSRIIKLKDGKIIEDTNPAINAQYNEIYKINKTKMSFKSALQLSLNNIKTKKGRTILTAFASSIGIIGIALILSISNGFNKKIEEYEKNTMSSFPISINNTVLKQKNDDLLNTEINYSNEDKLYSYDDKENKEIHINNISKDYIDYLKKINNKYLSAISYYRITDINLITSNGKEYKTVNKSFINLSELPQDKNDKSFLKDNYDLLSGSYPKKETDVVLIVDTKNKIDKSLMDVLFIDEKKEKVDFKEVVGKEFKLISNNDYYFKVNDNLFIRNKPSQELYEKSGITLKITGIVRAKKDNVLASIINMEDGDTKSKIGYSNKLVEKIILDNKESDIVKVQENSNGVVFMGGLNFDEAGITKSEALSMLGKNDIPVSINIYPNSFDSKEKIIKYLNNYNKNKENKDKIIYTDYAKEISELSSNIISGITFILVAFSSVSLIVSSIMIGIITYISVLERTKEIGILRSLGARKKDILRVFNAETLIIGLLSGSLGILITRLILFPINSLLYKLTDLKNIGILNIGHALILILISIILTLIGGFIPAKKASLKNPVEALRSE